jgi:hypothetical protein
LPGTPAIFDYGGTRQFAFEGALLLNGEVTAADYSDKGFGKVGEWWEPRPNSSLIGCSKHML